MKATAMMGMIILITISGTASGQLKPYEQKVALNDIEGQWYVIQSDYAMWTKGDKVNPTFNYTVEKCGTSTRITDIVKYYKKGKQKGIKGFDIVLNQFNTLFLWRGKGLLRLFKSEWSILYMDADKQWAIIHFEKSLANPEGYDVISRIEKPDLLIKNTISKKITELGIKVDLISIERK